MRKKILVTMLMTTILCGLVGCGSSEEVTKTPTETIVEETSIEVEESSVEETTENAKEAKVIEANEHLTNGRASLYGIDGTEVNFETAYNELRKR